MNITSAIENHIVDGMSLKQINYLRPVSPRSVEGKLAELYQQVRRDFQLVPPITLFSPSTDLLGAVWAISRESQIANGLVSRQEKEAVAAAVSIINTCPYCVDAHTGMLHATNGHSVAKAMLDNHLQDIESPQLKKLITWAQASRNPQSSLLAKPPFSNEQAPEIIGTALCFHFVNRMVSVFLGTSPLPVNTGNATLRKMAVRLFGATAGSNIVNKKVMSGDSLVFVPKAELPDDFSWAKPNPTIANAFAGFSTVMQTAGAETVPQAVRASLLEKLSHWQGEEMSLGHTWLDEAIADLKSKDQDIAKLVFLTAFTPYQVDQQIIKAFRQHYPSDSQLLAATSWASYAATGRISQWLVSAQTTQHKDTDHTSLTTQPSSAVAQGEFS